MNDYALVLECRLVEPEVLRLPPGRRRGPGTSRRAARSKGIGTTPQAVGEGRRRRDARRRRRCERPCTTAAPRSTCWPTWLRNRYGGARVLGVGHRVVHGGARYAGRRSSHPRCSRISASSCRWRHSISRTTWPPSRRSPSGCPACRRSPVSTRASIAASPRSPRWSRCRRRSATRASSATASTGCRTSTSHRCCRRSRRKSPSGRVIVAHLGSGASLCAMKNRKSVDSTLGFTALDGLCMGTRPGAIDPGVMLYLFQTLGLSAKEVETILYKKSGLLGISGISNDMRDLLGEQRAGGAARRRLLRLPRGEGDRRARRGPRRDRRPRLHGRHRRELARDPAPHLRGLGVARRRARRGGQRAARARASRARAAASRRGSFRPTKN